MPRFLGWVSEVTQCVAWTFSFWNPCSACVFKGDGFGSIDRLCLRNVWKTKVELSSYHFVSFSFHFPVSLSSLQLLLSSLILLSSFTCTASFVLILPYFRVSAIVQCRKASTRPLVSTGHPGPFTACCPVGLISFSTCSSNLISQGCNSQLTRFIWEKQLVGVSS